MRRLALSLLLATCVLPVQAQDAAGQLQPVPEPPPPPAGMEFDASTEPQVTISKRGADTVEEYRANGKLYMIKVMPANGMPPYYLVDDRGDGNFTKHNSLDSGLRVPRWVIFSF